MRRRSSRPASRRHRAREAIDSARGSTRIVILDAEQGWAALFASREGVLPPATGLPANWRPMRLASRRLLAGRPAAAPPDRGPIICVCFDLGMKTILTAIATSACERRGGRCRHPARARTAARAGRPSPG
jgi:hypothetical protein